MLIPCPNCREQVEQHRPPVKHDPNCGEAWVCMKCPTIICIHCYTAHNGKDHPAVYGPKGQPTEGGKKNSKHKKR